MTTSVTQRPALSPQAKKKQLWLGIAYLVAMGLGVINGLWGTAFLHEVADFIATIFIRLFKFISIPIIAVSIIATLSTVTRNKESGRMFKHTIFYTLLTTVIAATVAAVLFKIYAPQNVALPSSVALEGNPTLANVAQGSYLNYLQGVVPDNVLSPFLTANVLSVLLIAAAVGLAIAYLPKDSKHQEILITFFSAMQEVLFKIVGWIINVLPIGLVGFFSVLTVELGKGVAIGGLGSYFATVVTANLVQGLVILPLLLMMRGLNPLRVAKSMSPALLVAFLSKSSAGTLPVTMATAENRAGVRQQVSRFVLPICTTINMNGCAAFILTTVVYLMQNAGADITWSTLSIWIVIATIAAVGNAGVPMGCFFLSASLLASMNVPILLMGIILPFYAVLDAIETALNVWSDSTVAAMVNKDLAQDKIEDQLTPSNHPQVKSAA